MSCKPCFELVCARRTLHACSLVRRISSCEIEQGEWICHEWGLHRNCWKSQHVLRWIHFKGKLWGVQWDVAGVLHYWLLQLCRAQWQTVGHTCESCKSLFTARSDLMGFHERFLCELKLQIISMLLRLEAPFSGRWLLQPHSPLGLKARCVFCSRLLVHWRSLCVIIHFYRLGSGRIRFSIKTDFQAWYG